MFHPFIFYRVVIYSFGIEDKNKIIEENQTSTN